MYQIHLADTNSASFQLHSRCSRCARSYILRLYLIERRLNLYLEGVYLIHMFLDVFRPLDDYLRLFANLIVAKQCSESDFLVHDL